MTNIFSYCIFSEFLSLHLNPGADDFENFMVSSLSKNKSLAKFSRTSTE